MSDELQPSRRQDHWNAAYASKGATGVRWFEERPQISLDLIHLTGASTSTSLIDVGGGASRLVDALIEEGWRSLAVLDLSAEAITAARERLGTRAVLVEWIVADATKWKPQRTYDIWHDRAAFHFLTEPADRAAYIAAMKAAIGPGGHAIVATFAPDGPERCSGLPVVRYDLDTLAAELGPSFKPVKHLRHSHVTPWNSIQKFQFSLFKRVD